MGQASSMPMPVPREQDLPQFAPGSKRRDPGLPTRPIHPTDLFEHRGGNRVIRARRVNPVPQQLFPLVEIDLTGYESSESLRSTNHAELVPPRALHNTPR